MAGIASKLAGVARVAFEAQTGEFNRDMVTTSTRYRREMSEMSDATIKFELTTERLQKALARGPKNYAAIARAELAVRRATQEMDAELRRQHQLLEQNERSAGKFGRGLLAGSGATRHLGRSIAFASGTFLGGAGLAYAFTSTVKAAGDFQRSMNVLRAVTGGSVQQMEAARAKAVELGRDITLPKTSANDAATAMTTLAKAGLDMTNAIAGSEGVLRLAAAAQIDVAEAGSIAAKSIVSFGLSAGETTRVADVFANAANASVGEISDYSLALSQSSQVAKSWGLSIEESVATLANFAQAGIQGSDAGTSFRVMLSRLVPTSVAAHKAFEKLGISAFDSQGKIKPYRQILVELHKAFVPLSEEQKKLNVQMIFGQDAQRGAGIAILNNIENYDKMLSKIKETGTAQKYAAEINKGYTGSLDAFRSSVETLQISIGTKLLPHLTEALQAATDWVNKMDKSGEASKEFAHAAEDASTAVKTLVEIMSGLNQILGPVIDKMGGLENVLKAAFGIWLVRRLGLIKTGIKGIGEAAVVSTGQMAGLETAERRASSVPVKKGAGTFLGQLIIAATLYPSIKSFIDSGTNGYLSDNLQGTEQGEGDVLPHRNKEGVWVTNKGTPLPRAGQKYWESLFRQGKIGPNPGVSPTFNRQGPWSTTTNTWGVTTLSPNTTTTGGTGGRGGAGTTGDGRTQLQKIQNAISAAETTATQSDDLAAAKAEVAYYTKIASDPTLRGDALAKAKDDMYAAEVRRNSIIKQIEDDRTAAAKERARIQEEGARKRAAALKKAMAVQYKLDAETSNQLRKLYDKAPWKIGSDGMWHYTPPKGTKAAKDAPDFGKLSFDFLQQLQGFTNQFGANFSGGLDANGRILVNLTREQNGHLSAIRADARNPEAKMGRRDTEFALNGLDY